MLQIEGLQKIFGAVRAVDGVSFQVRKGEVIGLLGPNGAGKTTTMRLVTGFLRPDAGTITVNGIRIAENPIAARAAIGYLPENAPTYHDMEVSEFLSYVARLRKIPSSQRTARLKKVIGLCALHDVVGRPIGQLSRGYKQRVGLAQALIHEPPLLILDEPTTGLDPHQIQEIRTLIREIGRERTVILSTHIMQEVQAVCSRALIISKGKLVGSGTLEELLKLGEGRTRYHLKIKAARAEIEKNLGALSGLSLDHFKQTNGTWQSLVMVAEKNRDFAEEIFNWVVTNHWTLKELRAEASSLEEVFLELTKQ